MYWIFMWLIIISFCSRQQPKSHYTYSESLTYRERVTPDRKIGSPNMSRRGLRGANMKQDFSSSDLSTDESGHLNLRTRTIVRPMDALSGILLSLVFPQQISSPEVLGEFVLSSYYPWNSLAGILYQLEIIWTHA